MRHQQFVRLVPGAKTAVLFLHGICGSPNHFRQLLPLEAVVPENWSVYNIVLDGHCKEVADFGRSSMKKWKAQVQSVFDQLCSNHENVILVGHSMGTLLSIELALGNPEKVKQLFLLAVPVKVFVQPRAVGYLLRIAFDRIDPKDPVQIAMRNACGIRQTKKIWKYIPWSARMVELLRLCSKTAKQVGDLSVPCIAFQSEKDEMVSRKASECLRLSGRVEVIELPNSTHFYYTKEDKQLIVQRFRNICVKVNEKEKPC